MPVDRMRMRPWLELKLNSESDPCLSWMDKEKGVFMVSWRHASRSGWNESTDASIFREWAIHTGKFRADRLDPKTWKANFRCALHSLCDVRERRDLSTRRGGHAARVYVMLPSPAPKKTNKIKSQNKRRKIAQLDDSVAMTPQEISHLSSEPHTPHHSTHTPPLSPHPQTPHQFTHLDTAPLSPHHSPQPHTPHQFTHLDTAQLSPHHSPHPHTPHHSNHLDTPHPSPHHCPHHHFNSQSTLYSPHLENPHLSFYTDVPHHAHQWKTPHHHPLYSQTHPVSLLENPELLTLAQPTFCSSPSEGAENSPQGEALGYSVQISASYTVLQGRADLEVTSDDDVIELVDHLRQLHETAWEPRLVPCSSPY